MDIIKAVASTVPAPHQADLSKPDLIINVEVLKMTVGLGILPRFEEYKRYNPQMIAQKYNQDHNNADGLASRTFLSSHPITPSVNQVE
jgi:tRNA(Ser,Leu) C12 N-acetylase TAN1